MPEVSDRLCVNGRGTLIYNIYTYGGHWVARKVVGVRDLAGAQLIFVVT